MYSGHVSLCSGQDEVRCKEDLVRMDRKGESRDRNPNWQALDAVLGKKFKMFQDVKHRTIVWMFGGS